MKLAYRIISRISIALLLILTAWAIFFYFIMMDEINDETDDYLEDYTEYIITSTLGGKPLPTEYNGANNSYRITEVSSEYASQHESIRYYDEMVYIETRGETEPARILKTIFSDSQNNFYELTVSIPTIEKSDLKDAILYWIIFLYVCLLIVIICLNWFILQRNFKPLYKLLKWLNEFRVEKELIIPNIRTKTIEFQELNKAVIDSAKRNVDIYEQQKTFIGNASHELQTPLAICLNRLEMLVEDTKLTENQLDSILKTKQSLSHAVKINKMLLLLTKIENNQFIEAEDISVNGLINNLIGTYSEVFANRNISVSIEEQAQVTINMNETLASVLFGNLLKNAFVHNHDNGSINISITKNAIFISNTGIEIALNENLIFDRFYKTSIKDGSTGLGLALTKSICNQYRININYHFSEKNHIFSLFI